MRTESVKALTSQPDKAEALVAFWTNGRYQTRASVCAALQGMGCAGEGCRS